MQYKYRNIGNINYTVLSSVYSLRGILLNVYLLKKKKRESICRTYNPMPDEKLEKNFHVSIISSFPVLARM